MYGAVAGQRLGYHYSERENVGTLIDVATDQLLGRHIAERSRDDTRNTHGIAELMIGRPHLGDSMFVDLDHVASRVYSARKGV